MVSRYDDTQAALLIEKVAEVLGIPVEDFFNSPNPQEASAPTDKEEKELLMLFRKIEDNRIRAECLSFVGLLSKTSRNNR